MLRYWVVTCHVLPYIHIIPFLNPGYYLKSGSRYWTFPTVLLDSSFSNLTHSFACSFTHSLFQSFIHSTMTGSIIPPFLIHPLTHSFNHSHAHSFTCSLTHSLFKHISCTLCLVCLRLVFRRLN